MSLQLNLNPTQLKYHPLILDRVKAVREKRLSSNRKRTLKAAETPWRFDEPIEPCGTFLALPQVSSGRRKYIPIGFITTGLIPGNKLFFVDGAGLYEFGVLMSRVHNAWMRMVAGRLKSDYQYSSTIVYNTFAWPDTTPQQRERIETCAQAILDARDFYVGSTLADLYDPDDEWMYPKLVEAHRALDAAVEAAYGVDFNGDEEKIVAHLFKLYAEKTKEA